MVTVDGSLDFPTCILSEGVDHLVEEQNHADEPEDEWDRVVFGPDGSYRREEVLDGVAHPVVDGTWEWVGGGRIRMNANTEAGTWSLEANVEVSEGMLVLSRSSDGCATLSCLQYYEDQFVLVPGSLSRLRTESGQVFARSQYSGT